MSTIFHTIGITGYPRHHNDLVTHKALYYWLSQRGYHVIMEYQIACDLDLVGITKTGSVTDIGEQADLAIVIGGDGNMLCAARILAYHDIKVIGINRGNLGFLTDLDPHSAFSQLSNVLLGNFRSEKRFFLEVQICQGDVCNKLSGAINEVVLHTSKVAHMIEFEVYIDDVFAFSQRSDGLIVATPTGSTAYSLSAGGPIVTPLVNAIVLVPMFPHTLSSRPLVIDGGSIIHLKLPNLTPNLEVSCDSQVALNIQEGEEIFIRKSNNYLDLIHTNNYNYFNTLSRKLGWSRNNFKFRSVSFNM